MKRHEEEYPVLALKGGYVTTHPADDHVMVAYTRTGVNPRSISFLLDREQTTTRIKQLVMAARATWPDFTLEE